MKYLTYFSLFLFVRIVILASLPSSDVLMKSESVIKAILAPIPVESFFDDFFDFSSVTSHRNKSAYYGSLLQLDDVRHIIEFSSSSKQESCETMILGDDWRLLKRVKSDDDEYWSGDLQLFNQSMCGVSAQLAFSACMRQGYSMVINRMQHRWFAVFDLANRLETVFGARVNVNLYFTPSTTQPSLEFTIIQAFEAHFDWMDGLILQTSGKKTWKVYNDNHIVIRPRPDMKFKPLTLDLPSDPSIIELSVGDFLYLPRGIAHEAFTSFKQSEDTIDPTGAVSDKAVLASGEPSIHLTFGVEYASYCTFEFYLHHSLDYFFDSIDTDPDDEFDVYGSIKLSIDGVEQFRSHSMLVWSSVSFRLALHLGISRLAFQNSELRKILPLTDFMRRNMYHDNSTLNDASNALVQDGDDIGRYLNKDYTLPLKILRSMISPKQMSSYLINFSDILLYIAKSVGWKSSYFNGLSSHDVSSSATLLQLKYKSNNMAKLSSCLKSSIDNFILFSSLKPKNSLSIDDQAPIVRYLNKVITQDWNKKKKTKSKTLKSITQSKVSSIIMSTVTGNNVSMIENWTAMLSKDLISDKCVIDENGAVSEVKVEWIVDNKLSKKYEDLVQSFLSYVLTGSEDDLSLAWIDLLQSVTYDRRTRWQSEIHHLRQFDDRVKKSASSTVSSQWPARTVSGGMKNVWRREDDAGDVTYEDEVKFGL